MTTHDKYILETVEQQVKGRSKQETLEHLLSIGFIDRRNCERHAILSHVNQQVKEGMARCRAMEETAYKFCCSYEKVRGLVYNNPK